MFRHRWWSAGRNARVTSCVCSAPDGVFAVLCVCAVILCSCAAAVAGGPADPRGLDGPRLAFRFDGGGPFEAECPPPPDRAITLLEALRRGLCWSPKTREAWGQVQQSLAQLKGARAAYLPNLSGTLSGSMTHRTVTDQEFPFDDSNNTLQERSALGKLDWTLWDFGARRASLRSAAQVLAASRAAHDQQVQKTLADVAQDYFNVVDADAEFRADQMAEEIAQRILATAQAKFKGGTAPAGDVYDARAALARATMKRLASEGTRSTARGALAIALGLSPESMPELAGAGDEVLASVENVKPADLLRRALDWNPQITDAQATLAGSRLDLEAALASGRPTVSLQATIGLYNDGYAPGATYGPTDVLGRYITHLSRFALTVNIPLFDPSHHSKVAAARAVVRQKAADLEQARSEVALSVWNDYSGMRTAADTARAADALIVAADDSLRSAEALYRQGASPIVDVLNAQSSLTSARFDKLKAIAQWRSSRLALATVVGALTRATLDTEF